MSLLTALCLFLISFRCKAAGLAACTADMKNPLSQKFHGNIRGNILIMTKIHICCVTFIMKNAIDVFIYYSGINNVGLFIRAAGIEIHYDLKKKCLLQQHDFCLVQVLF